jgi:kinetochore protein Fta7
MRSNDMAKHTVQQKRKNETAAENEDEMSQSAAQPPHNKKRKSTSNPQPSANKKRKASAEDDSTLASSNPPKKTKKAYSHLRPHTRRIPQDTIQTTWKRLPEPAQRQVRSLFLSAKRSSLQAIRDPRRRTEAEAAVSAMVRKLEKQLPRMPFPPGAKGGSFGLDEVVSRSVSPFLFILKLFLGFCETRGM